MYRFPLFLEIRLRFRKFVRRKSGLDYTSEIDFIRKILIEKIFRPLHSVDKSNRVACTFRTGWLFAPLEFRRQKLKLIRSRPVTRPQFARVRTDLSTVDNHRWRSSDASDATDARTDACPSGAVPIDDFSTTCSVNRVYDATGTRWIRGLIRKPFDGSRACSIIEGSTHHAEK